MEEDGRYNMKNFTSATISSQQWKLSVRSK